MKKVIIKQWLAGFALAFLSTTTIITTPGYAGNASNGAALFEDNCSDCHAVKQGAPSRKGPNLFGVVGRKTGQVADFDYSDGYKTVNWVWTPELLDRYLTAPKEAMPGTRMKFKGMSDPGERADLIEYLSTLK